jgi:hypothetical protein
MKLQLQGQHLRLRIDESELTVLRAGGTLENATVFGVHAWRQTLRQTDATDPALDADAGCCLIGIPKSLIDAYAARLPCREGLGLSLRTTGGPALEIVLEVDVRDSVRTRGPRRGS